MPQPKKAAPKKAAPKRAPKTTAPPVDKVSTPAEEVKTENDVSAAVTDPFPARNNPPAVRDHKALEKKRQAELAEQRRIHKQRTNPR